MTRLSPDVGQPALMVPLLMRGLLLFIVLPAANVTFSIFAIAALTQGFAAAGHTLGEAHSLAVVEASKRVSQQASLTSLEGFYFLIGVAVCGGIFAAWQKQID